MRSYHEYAPDLLYLLHYLLITQGQWARDQKDGEGTWTNAEGSSAGGYKGGYARGVRDGRGEWRGTAGDGYVGYFTRGVMSGEGVFEWARKEVRACSVCFRIRGVCKL